MRPLITLRAALEDEQLFGRVLGGPSWQAWKIILIAAMGEALADMSSPCAAGRPEILLNL